jgi:hypothetical protein
MKIKYKKLTNYQVRVLEYASKEGNYIVPSMYYDFQAVKDSKGNHVCWFRKPTFEILQKHKFIIKNGINTFKVDDKIAKFLVA